MGHNKKIKIGFKFQVSGFRKIILFIGVSFILVLFSGLLSGLSAEAAEIFFGAPGQEIGLNKEFEVGVLLNTEGESINAAEGTIFFPETLLELKEIRDGNSIINFWIDPVRNCVSNGVERPNAICFSGITPGGYNGEKGLLFSLVFSAKKEGGGVVEIREAKALLNDGEGTEASLTISNFQFLISEQIPASQITTPKVEDRDPPEEFTPQIAADPAIFEGKWFLVFATQDKGLGIAYYAIRETRREINLKRETDAKWIVAESPYVLKDQKLRSYIFVKAIDKAGNERIASLAPQNPLNWYENYLVWTIIIIGVVIGFILWKIKRKKSFSV